MHKNKPFTLVAISAVVMGLTTARAQTTTGPAPKPPISQEEVEQLVAPIALYPDTLVTQILMASTYPLEVVLADRFAKAHKDLKGDALAKELEKQTWDPSVRSLVNFPTVLDMMNTKLDAVTKLGDAFLADQKRILEAIQKLRAKAQAAGNLKTNEQQKVIVETQATTQIIKIESPSPQVIYVPTYNPVIVYGTWPYPAHPPYYYHPPGYVATAAISFGVGVAAGVAWGYAWSNADWGRGDVNIDIDRNTNINTNIDRSKFKAEVNQINGGNKGSWQHNPQHRQGVAYRDDAAAKKFGGPSANQAIQSREQFRGRASDDIGGLGGAGGAGNRGGVGSAGGVGNRDGVGNAGGSGGAGNRGTGGGGGLSGTGSAGGNKGGALNGIGQSGGSARSASDRGANSRNGAAGGSGGARRK